MFENIAEFYQEADSAVKKFESFLTSYDLSDEVAIDHIRYGTSCSENFDKIRRMFENEGKKAVEWSYQKFISGRRVSVYYVNTPLQTSVGLIDLVELADPKPEEVKEDGFHHLGITTSRFEYNTFVDRLKSKGLRLTNHSRPNILINDADINGEFIVRVTNHSLRQKILSEI